MTEDQMVTRTEVLSLTTEIVAAHVANNAVAVAEVAYLDMGTVHHQSAGIVTAGQSVYQSNTTMSAKTDL